MAETWGAGREGGWNAGSAARRPVLGSSQRRPFPLHNSHQAALLPPPRPPPSSPPPRDPCPPCTRRRRAPRRRRGPCQSACRWRRRWCAWQGVAGGGKRTPRPGEQTAARGWGLSQGCILGHPPAGRSPLPGPASTCKAPSACRRRRAPWWWWCLGRSAAAQTPRRPRRRWGGRLFLGGGAGEKWRMGQGVRARGGGGGWRATQDHSSIRQKDPSCALPPVLPFEPSLTGLHAAQHAHGVLRRGVGRAGRRGVKRRGPIMPGSQVLPPPHNNCCPSDPSTQPLPSALTAASCRGAPPVAAIMGPDSVGASGAPPDDCASSGAPAGGGSAAPLAAASAARSLSSCAASAL
jgi:hypothetical protein